MRDEVLAPLDPISLHQSAEERPRDVAGHVLRTTITESQNRELRARV
jgi:hypothetical protein